MIMFPTRPDQRAAVKLLLLLLSPGGPCLQTWRKIIWLRSRAAAKSQNDLLWIKGAKASCKIKIMICFSVLDWSQQSASVIKKGEAFLKVWQITTSMLCQTDEATYWQCWQLDVWQSPRACWLSTANGWLDFYFNTTEIKANAWHGVTVNCSD